MKKQNINQWINYGDVNPLDYNGLWLKKDTNEGCFYFVKCTNMQDACGEDGYLCEEGYIDINDSWIKWDNILTDEVTKDSEDYLKAIEVINYYSIDNFGSYEIVRTRKELRQYINSYGIVIHRGDN